MRPALRLLALGAVLGLVGAAGLRAQFTVTSLVNLGADTVAYDINDHGQVVGYNTASGQAFLYSGGVMTDLGGGQAYAINNSGQVAGITSDWEAFVYSGGVRMVLGAGSANDINDSGLVTGAISNRAFIYDIGTGSMSWLDATSGSSGLGINQAGHVVGTRSIFQPTPPYFTYDSFYRAGAAGSSLQIPGTNPEYSVANSINDQGVIVGTANNRAFVFTVPSPTDLTGGSLIDLGTFDGGDASEAKDINEAGWVVGLANKVPGYGSNFYAFLYVDGTMYDLAELAAPLMSDGTSAGFVNFMDLGHIVADPMGINEAGQIVGVGTYFDGLEYTSQAFILTLAAIPEPSTCVALAGLVVLGAAVWRRRGSTKCKGVA